MFRSKVKNRDWAVASPEKLHPNAKAANATKGPCRTATSKKAFGYRDVPTKLNGGQVEGAATAAIDGRRCSTGNVDGDARMLTRRRTVPIQGVPQRSAERWMGARRKT